MGHPVIRQRRSEQSGVAQSAQRRGSEAIKARDIEIALTGGGICSLYASQDTLLVLYLCYVPIRSHIASYGVGVELRSSHSETVIPVETATVLLSRHIDFRFAHGQRANSGLTLRGLA
jgi:hypothetical protein